MHLHHVNCNNLTDRKIERLWQVSAKQKYKNNKECFFTQEIQCLSTRLIKFLIALLKLNYYLWFSQNGYGKRGGKNCKSGCERIFNQDFLRARG